MGKGAGVVSLFLFAAASYIAPSMLRSQTRVTTAVYEGAEHFVIQTEGATWWYDRAGGGLSRLIDRDGRDWIGFRREPWNQTPASAASSYRGIPNFVYGSADGGAGHPGHSRCETFQQGGKFVTTSISGDWRWTWEFSGTYAQVTIERVGAGNYWFLYEGTPGGTYSPNTWYWGHDQEGPIAKMPDFLKGERATGNFRWAYFGERRFSRVLFVAQRDADEVTDSFGVMGNSAEGLASPDGMTVFGFGRAREAKPLLQRAPRTFYVGFYERLVDSASDHAALAQHLVRILDR
jgi:hypothetical protein